MSVMKRRILIGVQTFVYHCSLFLIFDQTTMAYIRTYKRTYNAIVELFGPVYLTLREARRLCAGGDSCDMIASPTTLLILISVACLGYIKRHG